MKTEEHKKIQNVGIQLKCSFKNVGDVLMNRKVIFVKTQLYHQSRSQIGAATQKRVYPN